MEKRSLEAQRAKAANGCCEICEVKIVDIGTQYERCVNVCNGKCLKAVPA